MKHHVQEFIDMVHHIPHATRHRTRTRWPMTLVVMALLFLLLASPTLAQTETVVLELNGTASVTTVESGVEFSYLFQYSCSSATIPCQEAIVTTIIPPELSGATRDVKIFGTTDVESMQYDAATRTATWVLVDPLPDGNTGELEMKVRFPAGSTPDGTTATVTATSSVSTGGTAISNTVTVTAIARDKTTTSKTVQTSVLDGDTIYKLSVCTTGKGGLNLSDVTITDTLPDGAVFVSASNGGTHNNGVVTWPTTQVNSSGSKKCVNRFVTVQYPSSEFGVGEEVINGMNATVTPLGESPVDMPLTTVAHNLQNPKPASGSIVKRSYPDAVLEDPVLGWGSFRYDIDFKNAGNVPLEDYTLVDIVPDQVEVLGIRIGENQSPTNQDVSMIVQYQTNLNSTWQDVPGSPFTTRTNTYKEVKVSTLGLQANEYVNKVRWVYPTLPVGFKADKGGHRRNGLTVRLPASELDRNGDPIELNDKIVNEVEGSYTYNSITTPLSTDSSLRVKRPTPRVRLTKETRNGSPANPGDIITYRLRLDNYSSGTGNFLNPVIADLLDEQLEYVENSWSFDDGNTSPSAPAPTFEQIDDYNGTGQTLLRWRWSGDTAYTLPRNRRVYVSFQVRVKDGTPPGNVSNYAYIVAHDNPRINTSNMNSKSDTNDLNDDGDDSDTIYRSRENKVQINSNAVLESQKWVKGQLDTTWHRYPNSGFTMAGGGVDYRMLVRNTGNVEMNNVRIVDVLPFIGDTGVRDTSSRDSRWRPQLIAPLAVPSGVTAYYSTEGNPCRPDIVPTGPAGCVNPNWTTSPDNITQVRSFMLEFGTITLEPLDGIEIAWSMRAPVGTPANLIAWNSFGYVVGRVDNGRSLLPAEPRKVGIAVEYVPPPWYGNYVWFDADEDGIQDPDETGVNGVRVELYQPGQDGIAGTADDVLIDTTYTISDFNHNPGYYQFSDILPGNYFARFYPPVGYGVTTKDAGNDELRDSDVEPATGLTAVTHLASGEIDPSWDLGLTAKTTASVGNYVWFDRNQDGIQNESTSAGLNGITVELYDASNRLISTTVTASDLNGNPGYYLFDDLQPGDYALKFKLPNGATFTTSQTGAGGKDRADSDVDASGKTERFSLGAGEYDPTWDAGIIMPTGVLSLGNRVWFDTDNDGVYEPNDLTNPELGVNNVRVNLYRDNGDGVYTPGVDEFVSTMTTFTKEGIPGYYLFEDLVTDDYVVQIDPSNFVGTGPLSGFASSLYDGTASEPAATTNNDANSDDDGVTTTDDGVVSRVVELRAVSEPTTDGDTDNNSNLTVDFGFYQLASLGNRVWIDADRNGIDDNGEHGVPNVTVQLYDSSNNLVGTTMTDFNGAYQFTNLVPGDYRVLFIPPGGHLITSQDQSGDDAIDSDADPTTGLTTLITLTAGQNDTTWDAGLYPLPALFASKNDTLAQDNDGNLFPSPGDVLTYTIAVDNDSPGFASDVTLNDLLDPNTTLVVGSVETSQGTVVTGNNASDESVVVNLGRMEQSGSAHITFTVAIVNPLPAGVKIISNHAIVSSNELPDILTDDPAEPAVSDPTVTAVTAEPLLVAEKGDHLFLDNDGNGYPSPGDEVLYDLSIHNNGNTAATGVSFRDLLDPNTTLVVGSVTTTQGSAVSGNASGDKHVELDIGTVVPDSHIIVTFRVTINDPLPVGTTQISNQWLVFSNELPPLLTDDPDEPGGSDGTVTAVTAAPLLTAEKRDELFQDNDGNGYPSPGDVLLYEVLIHNNGNTAATDVVFDDHIDTNTTLVAGTLHTTHGSVKALSAVSSRLIEVQVGNIPAHEYALISYHVTINNPLPEGVHQIENQGTVVSSNYPTLLTDDPSEIGSAEATVTVVLAEPLLVVEKEDLLFEDRDGDGAPTAGDVLLYEVFIHNSGNTPATGVIFEDMPDVNTTLLVGSVKTSAGTVQEGNADGQRRVVVALGAIPPDGRAIVEFEVLINSTLPENLQHIYNQGIVTSNELPVRLTDDPDAFGEQDTTVTHLTNQPFLVAEKKDLLFQDRDADGVPSPGDELLYEVWIANQGAAPATGVWFHDTIDPNTRLVPDSFAWIEDEIHAISVISDTSFDVNIGTIPAGERVVIGFRVTINLVVKDGATHVSNQGEVISNEQPVVLTDDPDEPGGYDEPTITPVRKQPYLEAFKQAVLVSDRDQNGIPSPGDHLLYEVTIINEGTLPATGVVFRDTPDPNTTLDHDGEDGSEIIHDPQTSQGIVTVGNGAGDTDLEVQVGTIPAGDRVTVSFFVQVNETMPEDATLVSNQGIVSSNGLPETPTDDPSTVAVDDPTITIVTAAPDLHVFKTDVMVNDADSNAVVTPGDHLTYKITIVNMGNAPATGVIFRDTPDPNTTLDHGGEDGNDVIHGPQTSQGTVTVGNDSGDTSLEVDVGTIPPHSEVTISFQVNVNEEIPDDVKQIDNQGEIIADGLDSAIQTDDPNTPDGVDSTETLILNITPTAINLLSFAAVPGATGMEVRWSTAIELDTWGFEVWRSADAQRANAQRVTDGLIISKGGFRNGAYYTWRDTSVQTGVNYTYWLQEVEMDGTINEYGPTSGQGNLQAENAVFLPMINR